MANPKLSMKIRIVIGIASLPSLLLAAMLMSILIQQRPGEISVFEVIYALFGVLAMYIALTGKKFF